MSRGKIFQCEITMSTAVREKLLLKHSITDWEIEEVIYDDPHAFSLSYQDCYFIYGKTFAGRYLLVLVRALTRDEVTDLNLHSKTNVIKIITARDMNKTERRRETVLRSKTAS